MCYLKVIVDFYITQTTLSNKVILCYPDLHRGIYFDQSKVPQAETVEGRICNPTVSESVC